MVKQGRLAELIFVARVAVGLYRRIFVHHVLPNAKSFCNEA
jgi:hypothetical protein